MKNILAFIKRHYLLCPLLFSISTCAGLNYSGMCISEGRWLTDEERIRIDLAFIMDRKRLPIQTLDRGRQYYKQIPYENVESYLKNHPDCCTTNPKGSYEVPPVTFISRLIGSSSLNVIQINYMVRYLDEEKKPQYQLIKSVSRQDNCGKTVKF